MYGEVKDQSRGSTEGRLIRGFNTLDFLPGEREKKEKKEKEKINLKNSAQMGGSDLESKIDDNINKQQSEVENELVNSSKKRVSKSSNAQ